MNRARFRDSGARAPGVLQAFLLCALFLLAMASAPRTALAHAHLVRSSPGAGSSLSVSPDRIQIWFSEAVAPAMTRVTIATPAGERVSISPIVAGDSGNFLIQATIKTRFGPGRYRVEWTTVAQDDGHASRGSFEFRIVNSALAAGATAPTRTAPAQGSPREISLRSMDLEGPLYILARALNFAAIVTLLGVVAFRLLVIPAVVRGDMSGQSAAFAPVAARAGAKLGLLAGIAALLASLGRLRAEFSLVPSDTTVWTLLQTTWGHVWAVQVLLAVVACAAFSLAAVMERPILRGGAWLLAATAAVLMAATPALSGHAAGASHYRSLSLGLDIVHVLAAGGWLGGLLTIALAGVPAAMIVSSDAELGGGLPLIARIVNAFSPTALVFAACVVVTGSIAAWLRIGSVALLLSSAYGEALLIKLAFVAIVFAGGAYNWLRMRRALRRYESETAAVIKFRRTAWAELVTGLLVIIATAVLVALPPPTG